METGNIDEIYRRIPLDKIYFSSEKEIRDLFDPCFSIEELRTIEVSGRYGPHLATYAQSYRR